MEKLNYSKLNSFKNYLKTSSSEEYGLAIQFGSMGSGKSTFIAKQYVKWRKLRDKHKPTYYNFYTNIKLSVKDPNYHYLDLTYYKLTDYLPNNDLYRKYHAFTSPVSDGKPDTPFKIQPNSIIFIDELGILFNNRSYKNTTSNIISFLKLLRKGQLFLFCNSQSYDVEIVFKRAAKRLYLLTKFGCFSFSQEIQKFITITDSRNESGNVSAENQIVDQIKLMPIFKKGALSITFIPFYTDLFDTNI